MPEDIKAVYEAVRQSHDGIAEFRGKLLTLLPIASGAGIFLLVGDKASATPHLLPAGIFGALVTLGLFIYELRGIQTCNGLITCARRLEQELLGKLWCFGPFKFKRPSVGGIVGATGAASVIYPTVVGAWIYIAGIGWLSWRGRDISDAGEIFTAAAIAAGFAIVVLLLGCLVCRRQGRDLDQGVKEAEANGPASASPAST